MQYSAFIGRWQPPHRGHDWLFSQAQGPILILVRDIPPDEYNPLTTEQTIEVLEAAYADRDDVVVMAIPDITSVNYGRGVGYMVTEHVPPPDIGGISATAIRKAIEEDDPAWEEQVLPGAVSLLRRFFVTTNVSPSASDDIDRFAEEFISSMRWSDSTPDEIRSLVIGNIHGFANMIRGRLGKGEA